MWKFYVIIAICIQLTNGLCNSRTPCLPSTIAPNFNNLQSRNDIYSDKKSAAPPNNVYNFQNNQNAFPQQQQSNAPSPPQFFPSIRDISSANSFNSKLFKIMSLTAQHQNLVYSPISLEVILSFIFAMSEGKLSEELRQILAVSNNRTNVANTFQALNTPPTTLIMANKLYYDHRFGIVDQNVHNVALNSFATELEQMDFQTPYKAANIINSWVSEKTRNLIRDIITPSSISSTTNAILLNSIYFKSEWLNKFSSYDTQVQPFHVTGNRHVPVDMMFNEDIFRYGDFSGDLQATVVEMPYANSDLSMMLILPQNLEGLGELESKLSHYNLQMISQQLKNELVTVRLPRFKVEFDIDMVQPLKQLGLNALFNNEGKINLFQKQQKPLIVDQVKHKSFINVNEVGTEAAAATFAKYVPLSLPVNMKYFVADHPFIFVILNSNAIFFIGHVVEF